ncbi:furry-like [Homarus americanus]|uniref:Furry-like n=1 Tax=Homarus americanus TaxID=6706 RepID=A0A8J5MYL1_HOMAM|nr:furry-like [Homarus americanus]
MNLGCCLQQEGNMSKVIFSQSSELERQSSMASSTEEVSVAPGDTANDRTADDMTSSEKQFAVFKDFDFLEYELESQGEESVDNFNLWGVRRRSPSNLGDGDPLSHMDDIHGSELTPSHGKKPTPPADHEWWEEEGSVSPVDDPTLGAGERSAVPHTRHPQPTATAHSAVPPKLTLDTTASVRRPTSPTSMSDHSESSDGDLGDMTPCNASPSIAAMLFRPIRQPNDLEDTWRAHLLSLMAADAPILHPTRTCTLFNAVFSESVVKFSELVSESSQYLGESGEMMHNYGAFLHYLECLDGIKSTLKLQHLGESLPELCADEQHIDLCRCLYKIHFQLSLLYDTYTKLLMALIHTAKTAQASDHSVELSTLQGKLVAAVEQLDSTPPTTPTQSSQCLPPERELPELLQLVADQRWVGALQFVRQHRSLWHREASSSHTHDDITVILDTYCTYLADKKPGMIAVCGTEAELGETSFRLTEANMSSLSVLRTIEQTPKQSRESLESVIRKTEC